jgi:opacity protein-like surface antigen
MRRFALAAVLAGVGLVVSAAAADAQVVVGTRPVYAPTVVSPYGAITPTVPATEAVYTSGYYSPYPGYLYSPFANNVFPAGYGYGYGVGFNAGYNPYGITYTYRPRYYTSPPSGVLYGRPFYGRGFRY